MKNRVMLTVMSVLSILLFSIHVTDAWRDLFAAGMPVLHLRGAVVTSPEFAASPGAFRFIRTLWALGTTGLFSVILAARGLWSLRAAKRDSPT